MDALRELLAAAQKREHTAAAATAAALERERTATAALERERTATAAVLEREHTAAAATAAAQKRERTATAALERERTATAAALERECTATAALDRERAASAAALGRERAARELVERRAAQPHEAPPRHAEARGASFANMVAALAGAVEGVVVNSPAKAARSIQVDSAAFDGCGTPLSAALAALAAPLPRECWGGVAADELLQENHAYPHATWRVPAWIEAEARAPAAGTKSAAKQFLGGTSPPLVPGVVVAAWSSFPELIARPREAFHPPFNGEVKSALSGAEAARAPKMFDELLTYAMLGMLGSYFRGVPVGAQRFFNTPPYAFALAAFSHVGYIVTVEWCGKLLGCIVSPPFVLGSPAHAAAVAALPDADLAGSFVDVCVDDARVLAWPAEEGARRAVLWREAAPPPGAAGAADGLGFFKIIRGDAWPAARLRGLHAVYGALGAAMKDAKDRPPRAIVRAVLFYGAGALCVRMPWVRGRAATVAELGEGGAAVAPVAEALLWLARHGLLYTDLREPNVLVDAATDAVVLVDYDDLVVLEAEAPEGAARPRSGTQLCEALAARSAAAPFARDAGEPGARPAVMEALRRAPRW